MSKVFASIYPDKGTQELVLKAIKEENEKGGNTNFNHWCLRAVKKDLKERGYLY